MKLAGALAVLLTVASGLGEPCRAAEPAASAPSSPPAAKPRKKPRPKPQVRERQEMPARLGGEGAHILPKPELPPAMEQEAEHPPPYLGWMLKPLKRGMWIRLPVVDTDPNRGVTVGVMPIWVFKESAVGDRIREIHAPSVTYNKNFVVTPTYRYYLYPKQDATVMARGSAAKYEHEAMGHYEDRSFLGSRQDIAVRVQYNQDAGGRFFGLGPDSPQDQETNYKANYLMVKAAWGLPVFGVFGWKAHVGDRYLAQKVSNGPIPGLRGFEDTFGPAVPKHRHQSNEMRVVLDYDTRDHAVTPTRGSYVQVYTEHSVRGFLSEYDFNRRGLDARHYFNWQTQKRQVTALNARIEQLNGGAPFWLLPSLGGKYNLRAYGEGRYIDRSMLVFNLEQRMTLFAAKMGGVTTEFEVAPFAGVGTVAPDAGRYAARYMRPVFGGAFRAVARPQVVGSVDFGVGQEGVSVFMDINYSF